MTLRWPDRSLRPFNDLERELDSLEPAWADFAYGIRADASARMIRAPGRAAVRCDSLQQVQQRLELYRTKLEAGDRSGLFYALTFCAEENVPLPYWLAAEVLAMAVHFHGVPASSSPARNLHELFGLDALFPIAGKKARKKREDLRWQLRLWTEVRRLLNDEDFKSLDPAIKQAMENIAFPHQLSTAKKLYAAQQQLNEEHENARIGKRVNRLK